MRDVLYLAWRYLLFHRTKTLILIGSITITAYLPAGLQRLIQASASQLTARAEDSPLLLGALGSEVELVLNSLYFESATPTPLRYEQAGRLRDMALARVIPLHARFQARGYPIVGTTLDYLDHRELRLAKGDPLALLGECVVGSRVAANLKLQPGDSLLSSPESVFDLAGVYPLKMRVVGVLAPSGTADDRGVFVDLKTSWIIEGLGHGHQDLTQPEAASGILRKEGDQIVANAAVVQYNEITPANADSFHFHGSLDEFPLTAALVIPHDAKSSTILRGRYLGSSEVVQLVAPKTVMSDLLGTILTVQKYILAGTVLLGFSTLATATLVFMLSLRLRRREINTMIKIGGSRRRIFAILASEVLLVLSLSALFAFALAIATERFGDAAIRALLLH